MKVNFEKLSKSYRKKKLLVVGDVILDAYVWGIVERMSPEAPVPIVQSGKHGQQPGGAANVALNLTNLGAKVSLVGLVGDDDEGVSLTNALSNDSNISTHLLVDQGRPTTIKTRVIADGQHVVRIDREQLDPICTEIVDQLKEILEPLVQQSDGIILQDYNKGLFTKEIIYWTIAKGKEYTAPIYVDPKHKNFSCYKNVRMIKPNLSEFRSYVGKDMELPKSGFKLKNELETDILLVTKGAAGISIFYDHMYESIKTKARAVHDVSGAGDTVLGTFALNDVCGLSPKDSTKLANLAAGRVCEEVGIFPINQDAFKEILYYHYSSSEQ